MSEFKRKAWPICNVHHRANCHACGRLYSMNNDDRAMEYTRRAKLSKKALERSAKKREYKAGIPNELRRLIKGLEAVGWPDREDVQRFGRVARKLLRQLEE
ncbi:MAG: hypothetical protein Q7R39_11075 [Dehalococcoidia bacterium]|nr:hypothetical protein [Dehalococcoidia bacterium]